MHVQNTKDISNMVSMSMEQAMSLVKSRGSLRCIIKTDSLVVNGLERGWDRASVENELKAIFKSSEGVKDIKIITNNISQELLGHAYVNYVSQETAKKALAAHKYTAKIRGKQLKMMFSVRPNDLIHEDEIKMLFSVCVKNLDPAIDLQTLDGKFSKHGDILRSHVDDDTHGRDRFALIQFMDMSSAQDAVKKNQKVKFGNTIITVEAYRPKLIMDGSISSEQLETIPKQPILPSSQAVLQHMSTPIISTSDAESEVQLMANAQMGAPILVSEADYQTQKQSQAAMQLQVLGSAPLIPTDFSNIGIKPRWVNGQAQYHSDPLVSLTVASSNNKNSIPGRIGVTQNGISPVSRSDPTLLSTQEIPNGMDSARSQINQQSTNASLFGSDYQPGLPSPTAVSPAPLDQFEFNSYKLFSGTNKIITDSFFNLGEDELQLHQLLPQSVNQELDMLQSLKCPLTGETFQNPVMASDGVVYERSALQTRLQQSNVLQQSIDATKILPVAPLRDAINFISQQQSTINQQRNVIDSLKKRLEEIKNICSNVQF
eukprot:TRINITY_DN737_c0_g1_i10.p1 TRINITY_DN737_c0_g1~~TRINITY_DN737_c0_g1_i10.p1  ORF type:complete len:544 (-),score=66.38 TRINITY_DN737_c0_g1_i10:709-2340(-)